MLGIIQKLIKILSIINANRLFITGIFGIVLVFINNCSQSGSGNSIRAVANCSPNNNNNNTAGDNNNATSLLNIGSSMNNSINLTASQNIEDSNLFILNQNQSTHNLIYYQSNGDDSFNQVNEALPNDSFTIDYTLTDFDQLKNSLTKGIVRLFPLDVDYQKVFTYKESQKYVVSSTTFETIFNNDGSIVFNYTIDSPSEDEFNMAFYITDIITLNNFYNTSQVTRNAQGYQDYMDTFLDNIDTHIDNGYKFGYFGYKQTVNLVDNCENGSANNDINLVKNPNVFVEEQIANETIDAITYGVFSFNDNLIYDIQGEYAPTSDNQPIYIYYPLTFDDPNLNITIESVNLANRNADNLLNMFIYKLNNQGLIMVNSITTVQIGQNIPRFIKYDQNNRPLKVQNFEWRENGNEASSNKWDYVRYYDGFGLINNNKNYCGGGYINWKMGFSPSEIADATYFDSLNSNFFIGSTANVTNQFADLSTFFNLNAGISNKLPTISEIRYSLLGLDLISTLPLYIPNQQQSSGGNNNNNNNNTQNSLSSYYLAMDLDDSFLPVIDKFFPNINPQSGVINNNIISKFDQELLFTNDNISNNQNQSIIFRSLLPCATAQNNQDLNLTINDINIALNSPTENYKYKIDIDGLGTNLVGYVIDSKVSSIISASPPLSYWYGDVETVIETNKLNSIDIFPASCFANSTLENIDANNIRYNFNINQNGNFDACFLTVFNQLGFKKFKLVPYFSINKWQDLHSISKSSNQLGEPYEYILGANLDLSYNSTQLTDSFIETIAPFSGNLNGLGRTITIPYDGLFYEINNSSRIENLTLNLKEGLNYDYNIHKDNLGILSREVKPNSNLSNENKPLEIIDVEIIINNENPIFYTNTNNPPIMNIGGLFGRVEERDIILKNVIVRPEKQYNISDQGIYEVGNRSALNIGGFIGEVNKSNIKIEDSYVQTNIDVGENSTGSPDYYIGGFIGKMDGGSLEITNSFFNGNITENLTPQMVYDVYVGGMVGYYINSSNSGIDNSDIKIEVNNSYAISLAIGEFDPEHYNVGYYQYVGGLFGMIEAYANIESDRIENIDINNSYGASVHSVSENGYYGGLIGNYVNIADINLLNVYSYIEDDPSRYSLSKNVGKLVGIKIVNLNSHKGKYRINCYEKVYIQSLLQGADGNNIYEFSNDSNFFNPNIDQSSCRPPSYSEYNGVDEFTFNNRAIGDNTRWELIGGSIYPQLRPPITFTNKGNIWRSVQMNFLRSISR